MQKIIELATQINKFDWGYEMSDSYAVFDKWNPIKNLIGKSLNELTDDELGILQSSLDKNGDAVMKRYFRQYLGEPIDLNDFEGEISNSDNNEP